MNCEQAGCREPAFCAFVWPGGRPLAACLRHASWAWHVAEVMGFTLDVRRLEFVEAIRARDAAALLIEAEPL